MGTGPRKCQNNGDSVLPMACGKDELETNLDEPLESHDTTDILPWWKDKETRFPNLSKMAKDYLAIPGTSVSTEACGISSHQIVPLCKAIL